MRCSSTAGRSTRRIAAGGGTCRRSAASTPGCRWATRSSTSAGCTASRHEATTRARALLEELELADRWGDRTDKLSGGMQQRLQLATSLVHDPQVIVLDEPFSGLDPVAVASLSVTLRQRARAGCTLLFSSHQLDLVQDLCEEIVMVDHGRTVLSGEVAQLRAASGRRQPPTAPAVS